MKVVCHYGEEEKARLLLFLVFGSLFRANEFDTTRHYANKFYSFSLGDAIIWKSIGDFFCDCCWAAKRLAQLAMLTR